MTTSKLNYDHTSGKVMPVVNLNNCGGKEDCIPSCPFSVLEMQTIRTEDRLKLNLKGRVKTFFNSKKAYVIDPNACHACGKCVQVCPEDAIKLVRR